MALETHAAGGARHHAAEPRIPHAGGSVLVRDVRTRRAFIPLVPWLFTRGTAAIVASIILGAVASLAVGVVLATFTQRSRVRSALRQLMITAVAAGVTYGIGRAIGTGTG